MAVQPAVRPAGAVRRVSGPGLSVAADLSFEVEVPGRQPLNGRLRGRGQELELRVDDPGAFAGRADATAIKQIAAGLASQGLTVTVVAGDTTLVTLGATRTSWLQRRVTGSRHIRIGGSSGAWTAFRSRVHAPNDAVLPDRSLTPPPTPTPLAPTFLRRPRRVVTTTHDPGGGGNPRLILAPRQDPWPGDRQPVFRLRADVTTIGSGADCDIRLPDLEPLHAEVRHDADDEFVLVNLSTPEAGRVNGEPVRQRILRTASRVELRTRSDAGAVPGVWTLSFYREEYADHGRPYGGRIGGELGRQRQQLPRHRLQGGVPGTGAGYEAP